MVLAALAGGVLSVSLVTFADEVVSDEEAYERSTHIVTGRVVGVYRADDEWVGDELRRPTLVEIEVERVEKGEGIERGDLVYVRVWRLRRTKGEPAVGGPGYYFIPEKGDFVRAYIVRGKYDRIGQTDRGMAGLLSRAFDELPKR